MSEWRFNAVSATKAKGVLLCFSIMMHLVFLCNFLRKRPSRSTPSLPENMPMLVLPTQSSESDI